jgi:hypothetical protein
VLCLFHRRTGSDPIYFRDRPRYYNYVAELISPWREADLAMVRAAVHDGLRAIGLPRGRA